MNKGLMALLCIIVCVGWDVVLSIASYAVMFDFDGTLEARRKKWIQANVVLLQSIKPTEAMPVAEFEIIDGSTRCSFAEGEILIWINKNEWIYIFSHSSHKSDVLGDLVVAIDNKGNLYRTESHVCGGLSFSSNCEVKPRNPREFFENFLSWDREEWYRLHECGEKSPNQELERTVNPPA